MNIRYSLRKALLEGKHNHKNEFGCVMLKLDVDSERWSKMQKLIDKDDLYNPKGDNSYGREKEPHVTILFGIHETVTDEELKEDLSNIKKPKISIKNISSFSGDEFDVLKFDITSEDLFKLNKKFKEYPFTNGFKEYHPHCTIAYLKPNLAKKYIDKLKDFTDLSIEPEKIIYSKVDGENKTYSLV